MSTTLKTKKAQQPVFVTTGKGAPAAVTFGMTLLTFGLAFLLSKMTAGESYVLRELSLFMDGLAGNMWPCIPFLFCWGGIKLLVSARHKVSARHYFLVLCILFLLMAGYTLIAKVPMDGSSVSYMDYLARMRVERDPYAANPYYVYLQQAFRLGRNGAGGLLGMLIAYPIWKLVRNVLGTVLLAILLIVLLMALFRVNPGRLMQNAATKNGKRPNGKRAAVPVAAFDTDERTAFPAAEPVQPQYQIQQQPDPQPVPQSAFAPKNGFFSAQPNLYEEYFSARTPDAPYDPAASGTDMQSAEQPPYSSEPVTQPDPDKGKENGKPKWNVKSIFQKEKTAPSEKRSAHTEETTDDDLPWDDAPLNAEQGRTPLHATMSAGGDDGSYPLEEPRQTSWSEQVRIKQAEAEGGKPTRSKASASSEARPVYTDPVMPITRERIAINRRDTEKKEDEKIDGTLAPKKEQTKMRMSVPYNKPPVSLLKKPEPVRMDEMTKEDQHRAAVIINTLSSFKINATVRKITHGPSVTQFAIEIGQGIKVSRVTSLATNLTLNLEVENVRIVQVPHTSLIGIEVANITVTPVTLLEVLESKEMKNNPSPLLVALGKDIAGNPILCDLSEMPHLLIAGQTGSGKSVCINSIICSMLYRASPQQVRLIMVDPKQVELTIYNDMPHLLLPVIGDARKVGGALEWAVQEMESRYSKFNELNIRSLARYNHVYQGTDKVLPSIVIIIDELADLMQVCRKEIESSIQRLSGKARAAGIYLVLATQRPSVSVITGDIKNNIPSRIAFSVPSGTDSSTILDSYGAEKLIGHGDMLYKPTGKSPVRVQGCFTTDDEVNHITEYIKKNNKPGYDEEITEAIEQYENAKQEKRKPNEISGGEDERNTREMDYQTALDEAIDMALESGQISTSWIQRRLKVGYARAGRMVDEMEKRGIISHSEGSKPRKTLMTAEEYYRNAADLKSDGE